MRAVLFGVVALLGLASARLSHTGGERRINTRDRSTMQDFKSEIRSSWNTVTINTTTGPITGACDPSDDVCVFLGVPFAAPPVGDLRWMSAKPVSSWTTPLDCTWYRPACMQKAMPEDPGMSEDCLYMNIYVPKEYLPGMSAAGSISNLPSMIFTFGGSWEFGSGADAAGYGLLWYDGTNPIKIARAAGTPTIFIAINYRVNAFHALGSPALQAWNKKYSEGEVGTGAISDQRMAYTWWTANAANFGGSPSRRTIFGESAGAGSVSIHLTTPSAWNLFDQALTESGPCADWTSQYLEQANETYVEIATKAGCPVSGEESVVCLRKMPASFFVKASLDMEEERDKGDTFPLVKNQPKLGITGLRKGLKWAPIVDGVVVMERPKDAMDAGRIASDKPAVFHTNRNELTVLAPFGKDIKESEYIPELEKKGINATTAKMIYDAYPPANYSSLAKGGSTPTFQALCAALTDFAMFCPSRRMSIARNENRVAKGLPANNSFNGVLMHKNFAWDLFQPQDGVPHMMELISVWDWKKLIWTKADADLANFYVQTWSHFATFGTPALMNSSSWEPYTYSRSGTGADNTFLTHSSDDQGAYGVNTADFRKDNCEMWDLLEHTLFI